MDAASIGAIVLAVWAWLPGVEPTLQCPNSLDVIKVRFEPNRFVCGPETAAYGCFQWGKNVLTLWGGATAYVVAHEAVHACQRHTVVHRASAFGDYRFDLERSAIEKQADQLAVRWLASEASRMQ